MIVLFFLIYSYTCHLLKTSFSRKKNISQNKNKNVGKDACRIEYNFWKSTGFECGTFLNEELGSITFEPPVYLQRYNAVSDVLLAYRKNNKGCIKKVVDFGCSEIGFFSFIKNTEGVEEYLAVDIDRETLERFRNRVRPLTSAYLSKRSFPLSVEVLQGSVTQPDARLINTNAVVAIELIEHLFPTILEDVPYSIFGVIQPDIAIFTTPNGEFNVIFPNFQGFRHPDHKFEWCRDDFEAWCANICVRYPLYKVSFHGIGPSPPGKEHLGGVSQMAVFYRQSSNVQLSDDFGDYYESIYKDSYPYETLEEKRKADIEYEIQKVISRVSSDEEDRYIVGDDRLEVPLHEILKALPIEITTQQLEDVLLNSMFQQVDLTKDQPVLIIPLFEDHSTICENDLSSGQFSSGNNSDVVPVAVEDWLRLGRRTPKEEGDLGPPDNQSSGWSSSGEDDQPTEDMVTVKCNDMNSKKEPEVRGETEGEEGEVEYVVDKSKTKIDSTVVISGGGNRQDAPGIAGPSGLSLTSSASQQAPLGREDSLIELVPPKQSTDKVLLKKKPSPDKQSSSSPFTKCHSLENIVNCTNNKQKIFRYSLNIDKKLDCDTSVVDMELDTCEKGSSVPSLTDSRAVDSGYPNSYQDMELDLTPEQVDEILTENESSLDEEIEDGESSGEEGGDGRAQVNNGAVVFVDNVENGDVANNNRDGEGNNMEIVGEELRFEGVVVAGVGGGEDADAAAGGEHVLQPEEQANSEDEGLYVSALDLSNDTLVAPEDLSSSTFDELGVGYSSLLEVPSLSNLDTDQPCGVYIPLQEFFFPEWLLNIMVEDDGEGGGDGSEEVALFEDVSVDSGLADGVEATVAGDTRGGGEPVPEE